MDSSLEVPTKLFDFYDFLQKNYINNLIKDIENQISKTIIYKNHTEYFIKGHSNGNYKIEQFCGLSCYVPRQELTFINNFYHKLEWTKDSGFEYLLD
ncbi:MAG: hypothetical protein CR961_00620 [Polaribacter sp.]|nr:MAG: hypothetical protein CR961_00620 [Polaribacter sp.]